METESFYANLRQEDRERVRLTVDGLKTRGFGVYATGSSLERADYRDVDLLAEPQKGMTEGDVHAGLDSVVAVLEANGAHWVRMPAFGNSMRGEYEKLLEDNKRRMLYIKKRIGDVPFKKDPLERDDSIYREKHFEMPDLRYHIKYISIKDLLDKKRSENEPPELNDPIYGEKPLQKFPHDTDRYAMSPLAYRRMMDFGTTQIDISVSYEPFGLAPGAKKVKL